MNGDANKLRYRLRFVASIGRDFKEANLIVYKFQILKISFMHIT